jgi:hypothetical protein
MSENRLLTEGEDLGYHWEVWWVRDHFCGYVDIPLDHPLANESKYSPVKAEDLLVHGGVTYDQMESDCRRIGWDASHAWDYTDWMADIFRPPYDLTRWSTAGAEIENRKLIRQIKKLEHMHPGVIYVNREQLEFAEGEIFSLFDIINDEETARNLEYAEQLIANILLGLNYGGVVIEEDK